MANRYPSYPTVYGQAPHQIRHPVISDSNAWPIPRSRIAQNIPTDPYSYSQDFTQDNYEYQNGYESFLNRNGPGQYSQNQPNMDIPWGPPAPLMQQTSQNWARLERPSKLVLNVEKNL